MVPHWLVHGIMRMNPLPEMLPFVCRIWDGGYSTVGGGVLSQQGYGHLFPRPGGWFQWLRYIR